MRMIRLTLEELKKINIEQICKNCGKILDKHDYESYCVDDNGFLIVTQKFELKKNIELERDKLKELIIEKINKKK